MCKLHLVKRLLAFPVWTSEHGGGVGYTPDKRMSCNLLTCNKILLVRLQLGVDVFNWIGSRCVGGVACTGTPGINDAPSAFLTHFTTSV